MPTTVVSTLTAANDGMIAYLHPSSTALSALIQYTATANVSVDAATTLPQQGVTFVSGTAYSRLYRNVFVYDLEYPPQVSIIDATLSARCGGLAAASAGATFADVGLSVVTATASAPSVDLWPLLSTVATHHAATVAYTSLTTGTAFSSWVFNSLGITALNTGTRFRAIALRMIGDINNTLPAVNSSHSIQFYNREGGASVAATLTHSWTSTVSSPQTFITYANGTRGLYGARDVLYYATTNAGISWATLKAASTAQGNASFTADTLILKATGGGYAILGRVLFNFNTILPDNATVNGAELRWRATAKASGGAGSTDLSVALVKATPGDVSYEGRFATTDWAVAFTTTRVATDIGFAALSTTSGTNNAFVFSSAGLGAINATGVSSFMLAWARDVDNVAPASLTGNMSVDLALGGHGTTSNWPVLYVTFTTSPTATGTGPAFRMLTGMDNIGLEVLSNNKVRFMHSSGIMGISLVSTTDASASPIRIYDGTNVMAFRSQMRTPIGTTRGTLTFDAADNQMGDCVFPGQGTIAEINAYTGASVHCASGGPWRGTYICRGYDESHHTNVARFITKFNLTGFPTNATVVGATLSLYQYNVAGLDSDQGYIGLTKQKHPGLNNTISPFDWSQVTTTRCISDFHSWTPGVSTVTAFAFNSAGLEAIVINTRNAFALRTVADIDATNPTYNDGRIGFMVYTDSSGAPTTGLTPRLTVTYSIPVYSSTYIWTL